MNENKYVLVPVGEINKYENNSRVHSKEQISKIRESILEFGFTNPILIDDDNCILAGHGRFQAACEIGIEKIPCIVLSGLTEMQKKAYVITDNRLAEMSTWDIDMLAVEIESLGVEDFNLDLLGFDDKYISKIFDETRGVKIESDIEVDDDFKITISGMACDMIEVVNIINSALSSFKDIEIICNEQVQGNEN